MMNTNNNEYLNSRFGMDMTILKASVYKKHWECVDPNTGEVHEGDKYLTLVACVPTVEFMAEVQLFGKDKRPNTMGVFVATIGSTENLIVTNTRVGLRTYQDHLESIGWEWIQTIPKCKGKTWDWVQKKAWWIIKYLNDKKLTKYQENWYSLRNALDTMLQDASDNDDHYNALFSVSVVMDNIENSNS